MSKHPNTDKNFIPLTTIIDDLVIETSDGRPRNETILGVGYNTNGVFGFIGYSEEDINLMKEDVLRKYFTCTTTIDELNNEDCVYLETSGLVYKSPEDAIKGHNAAVDFIKKYGKQMFFKVEEDEIFWENVLKGKSVDQLLQCI